MEDILEFMDKNKSYMIKYSTIRDKIIKENSNRFKDFLRKEIDRSWLWKTIKPEPPD